MLPATREIPSEDKRALCRRWVPQQTHHRVRCRHGLLGLAVLFGLCLPLPVAAQQGVGAIGGIVTDDSGGVLPGVTVTLSNPGIIGGNQDTVSNDRGAYQFIRLVPGTYSVAAELSGFTRAVQQDVVVNANAT